MAFGLLASTIPIINKDTSLYTSSSSTLVEGKISISHKNYNPVKVRVAISTNGVDQDYLHYNRILNYGETFETDTIYFGNGQRILVRSTDPDTNFVLYGETSTDSTNSGFLSSVQTAGKTELALYTAPVGYNVTATVVACNLNSVPAVARLGITTNSLVGFTTSQFLEYDASIEPGQTYVRKDLKLSPGPTLVCSSSDYSYVNYVVYGVKTSPTTVAVDATFATLTANKLIVQNGGVVTGVLTATSFNGSINASNLTGRIPDSVTGSSVISQSKGLVVGAANTINFNSNLNVVNTNRVATVNLDQNINITSATLSGALSVGSTINALNNKVINVGTATSNSDAANKLYVDTRSIVMSISLS